MICEESVTSPSYAVCDIYGFGRSEYAVGLRARVINIEDRIELPNGHTATYNGSVQNSRPDSRAEENVVPPLSLQIREGIILPDFAQHAQLGHTI